MTASLRASALHAAGPSAGRRGARFGRRGGGAAPSPYSPAASALQLPNTAIWISTSGLTLADGDTTVDSWLAGWGGIRPTLTAPAATNRPAYTAGAVPTLTFDGTDNVLRGAMTKGSAWADYEWGVVGSRVAFGSGADVWLGYYVPAATVFRLADQAAATARASVAGGADAVSTSDPDGVTAHWSGDATGTAISFRRAGTIEAGAVGAVTSRADGKTVVMGAHYDGTAAANVVISAAYIGPALTADQRTYLRALLTALTGVSS